MTSSTPRISETTPTSPQPAPVGRWTVLTVIAALICLVCAAFIGFLALGSMNDPYTDPGDYTYRWSQVGIVTCIPSMVAALCCLLVLITRSIGVLRVTRICLLVSIVGMICLTAIGFLLLQETERQGGDWAALGIFAVYAFCIAPPIIVGVLNAFLFLPLARIAASLPDATAGRRA